MNMPRTMNMKATTRRIGMVSLGAPTGALSSTALSAIIRLLGRVVR